MRIAVIYLITNLINAKTYVGVTRFALAKRWGGHVATAKAGGRSRLGSAIRKYGPENFDIAEIASCLSDSGSVEREVIKSFRPDYNQTNGGEHTIGRKHTPETVARIIAKNRGKKRTPEQRAANSAQAAARHASDPDYRARCTASLARGRLNVDQAKRIAAVREGWRVRDWTEADAERHKQAHKGRKPSPTTIAAAAAKHRKPIMCVNTGEVFSSALEASAALGVGNYSISKVARGTQRSASGLQFRFVGG
jgi:group I intron endonuclease